MPHWCLQDAADYLRTAKAPKPLLSIMNAVKRIFTFTHERANRLVRFTRVVRDYKNGVMVDDITSRYGCSKHTVLRYARLAGCSKRPRGFDPKIKEAAMSLYKMNRPVAEIAARLGVSEAYVSKTASELGVQRRTFKRRNK